MDANRYELGGLKMLCESGLCTTINSNNVAERLVLSEQMQVDQLKEVSRARG